MNNSTHSLVIVSSWTGEIKFSTWCASFSEESFILLDPARRALVVARHEDRLSSPDTKTGYHGFAWRVVIVSLHEERLSWPDTKTGYRGPTRRAVIMALHEDRLSWLCMKSGYRGSAWRAQCWALSRYAYRYRFIAITFSLSLSIYRCRDTFVSKSAIIDNKIQQVIEKQFHTWSLPAE